LLFDLYKNKNINIINITIIKYFIKFIYIIKSDKKIIFYALNNSKLNDENAIDNFSFINNKFNQKFDVFFFEIDNFTIFIFYISFFIFRFIKKFENIVVGNIFIEIYLLSFFVNSKNKYLIDDGTNTIFIDKFEFKSFKFKLFNILGFTLKSVIFFTLFNIKKKNFISIRENKLTFLCKHQKFF
jgi:hypothetical protein